MSEYKFECPLGVDIAPTGPYRVVEKAFGLIVDAAELLHFEHRVRLPFSGRVAALYSRLDAWKRECVEQRAQVAFERGWV